MSYRNLTDLQKKDLLTKITWDYNVDYDELLHVVKGIKNKSGAFTRSILFARSLETFLWDDLVNLWGLERCIELYTDDVRRMLFSKELREEYDAVFSVLRGNPLPVSRRSPKDIERLRSSLLFNRRNRCKQRVFKSPLLRRP